ncbi:hypothetical protein AB0K09_00760 [Streptomyces sp. NPDC049577]|uniref:hypothetical protein n=1 Tax=Streptomyces sp. NPDC049577 TaxID=3155153 RepID=UPI0034488486
MSWPQHPQEPQQPQQSPQQPQSPPPPPPPGGGFGPAPTWGPEGTGHAQPTVFAQPAVAPPPGGPGGPAGPGGPGAPVPPPPPHPYGAAPAYVPQPPLPPQPPQGGSGGGNKKTLAIVGGVVALALVGGGLAYAFTSGGGKDKKDDQAGKAKNGSAGAPAQPGGGAGGDGAGGDDAKAPGDRPMVAGWQTQTRQEHSFRFDVPGKADNWKVFDPDTAISYTDNGKPIVVMTGTANYKEGGCASSANPDSIGEAGKGQLATTGTTGGGTDGDLKTNARNWAGNWGVMAYGGLGHKPQIQITDEKPWKHNGIDGWTATAKVTVTNRPSPCVPPTAIVKSIAQKMPDGTFHGWVIYADQGVPDALSEAQIDKIMGTVRVAKGDG